MEGFQSTKPTCRLCGTPTVDWARSHRGEHYRHCPGCDAIQLSDDQLPSPEQERRRYREHNNQPDNADYLGYLKRFADSAVAPHLAPPGPLLDFGSGPSPVLSALLAERGYHVASYDPLFADTPRLLDPAHHQYRGIVLLEVIEHLHQPRRELDRLMTLLAPEGRLILRTGLFDALPTGHPEAPERFLRWWYRRDPTHVWFMTPRTVDWVARTYHLSLVHRAPGVELTFERSAG